MGLLQPVEKFVGGLFGGDPSGSYGHRPKDMLAAFLLGGPAAPFLLSAAADHRDQMAQRQAALPLPTTDVNPSMASAAPEPFCRHDWRDGMVNLNLVPESPSAAYTANATTSYTDPARQGVYSLPRWDRRSGLATVR